jgi:hypothetical protein
MVDHSCQYINFIIILALKSKPKNESLFILFYEPLYPNSNIYVLSYASLVLIAQQLKHPKIQ